MQEHIAYFDNAATSFPKPETVYQAMDDCARNYGVSMGRRTTFVVRKSFIRS